MVQFKVYDSVMLIPLSHLSLYLKQNKILKRQQIYLGLNTTFPWPYSYIVLGKSYGLVIFP